MQIKVDYSEEVKHTGKHNVPGEFVIYTRKHFWNKWQSAGSYADYRCACFDATQLREMYNKVPKYF